jgi:23S rRNA (cytosine1962-C5)-methyltransferase
MQPRVTLKKHKDKPVRERHPWVFSGAIERHDACSDGDTVEVLDHAGAFLGRGAWSGRSQIAVRLWSWDPAETVDAAFFARRLAAAVAARRALGLRVPSGPDGTTDAFRVVNAESDLLPGLVVDAYGPYLAVQATTCGAARWLPEIVAALAAQLSPRGIWQRSDAEACEREGLELANRGLHGEEPPAALEIREHGLLFQVDLRGGQKTGFFLDQRENRDLVARCLAAQAQAAPAQGPVAVLNAFAYTGGFGVYAARACPGAQILNLDASAEALALARANFAHNGLAAQAEFLCGNAFELLRRFRDARRAFDAIILDPPKFAQRQGQVPGACRGYKDLNLLAIKLLRPGGLLASFSCSGLVSAELFRDIVAGAAADSGRAVQLLARLGAGPDHPVSLAFPEGEYLKGLLLRCE